MVMLICFLKIHFKDLTLALHNSSRIDVIYFDFAKALNCVNKLKHKFGIDGPLLQFIRAYLQDRNQQSLINGTISEYLSVHSEVPRGSILGLLDFLYCLLTTFKMWLVKEPNWHCMLMIPRSGERLVITCGL